MRGYQGLLSALRRAFPRDNVQGFTGSEPIAEQAKLFHSAALIAGPHGAAFANVIWCKAGASLVEFHRLNWRLEPNSPLYALLARSLYLRHWVIVDTETEKHRRGYDIPTGVLVQTSKAALAVAEGAAPASDFSIELSRAEWL